MHLRVALSIICGDYITTITETSPMFVFIVIYSIIYTIIISINIINTCGLERRFSPLSV